MKQIPVSLSELYNRRLPLGRVGENQHVQIVFQCNAIFADYPNATTLLIVTAPGGESYAPEIEKNGTNILWTVTDSDLAKEGGGELQLTFTNGTEIIKSYIGKTQVFRSIAENGEIPTPVDIWITRANETVRQAAQEAADATVEDLAEEKDAAIAEIQAQETAAESAIAQAAADARASIPGEYRQLSDDVSGLKSALSEIDNVIYGVNLYNPALQTPETISPHYYYDGVPYSTTQFDAYWNCTAPIAIEPNTTYTIGLVPAFESYTAPWGNAAAKGFLYDSNGDWISNIDNSTFTTPSNAAFFRFNYGASTTVRPRLDTINSSCMLVKGDTLPSEYEPYFETDKITVIETRVQTVEEEVHAKADGAEVNAIKSEIEDNKNLINERTLYLSENLYNPSLQTSETISPHYYYDGVPYSSTQFDPSYNCSGPIQVKPNTQYTIGLIPGFNSGSNTFTVPWGVLEQAVFFYDEDGTYISKSDATGTFTTPANTKYIRFNYYTSLGLANLNATCVIVYGDTLPDTYIPYNEKTVKEEIARIEEKVDGFNEEIAEVAEAKEVVNLLLGNYEIIRSANLYDASLQTPDTISPHYYYDGVPYSSTNFDTVWNCTAMFDIEPGTQYTIGLVPAVVYNQNTIVKPWHNAARGIFFYDSEGAYISGSSNNTFTTPSNAKYARFNYYISAGIVSLSVLNSRCMLVKGDTLPTTYQEFGDRLESDFQNQINSIDVGFEWKFSGSDLLIGYGYNSTHDAVIVMNEGRANGLFDFAKFALKPKGKSLSGLETADLTTVWNSGTDMHGPFQFNAVNNADGYHSDNTDPGFVGGNHTLDQLGADFKTASSKYVMYFADGRPVSSGYGKATHFEIRWANDVQAYNTVKEDGGGRVCLTEFHDMIFDGVQFSEIVKLVPLEDINMRLWYGFQFVSWGSQYTNLRFLDGANRGVYTSGIVNSGNILTSGMEAYGDEHMIVLTVDIDFDLGKRELVNSGYFGAFTSGSKGYFRIITKGATFVMNGGDAYYLRGTWRFCHAISTGN